jgi:hypothetical protein
MTSFRLLVIIALVQAGLAAGLIALIIVNRWVRGRHEGTLAPRRAALTATMRAWALGPGNLAAVLSRFAAVPPATAIDALARWSARFPGERSLALAEAVQREPWTQGVRAQVHSARWWKRLEAARFLSVAATPADTQDVLRLLRDPHPAVHIAALATLERLDSPALAREALELLPAVSPTLSGYYAGVLRRSRPTVVALLLEMLAGGRTADPNLARIADFAARLKEPRLREALTALAGHPASEVRVQVARALGGYPHPDSHRELERLAADPAWAVRAQAVRSLGVLGDPASLPVLRGAASDSAWWVRLRACLGLTRFGSAGTAFLLEAEVGPNREARDMARLILGLSPQALAEFAA